jgi:hypothetical protein
VEAENICKEKKNKDPNGRSAFTLKPAKQDEIKIWIKIF